jgi:hypothetical protein
MKTSLAFRVLSRCSWPSRCKMKRCEWSLNHLNMTIGRTLLKVHKRWSQQPNRHPSAPRGTHGNSATFADWFHLPEELTHLSSVAAKCLTLLATFARWKGSYSSKSMLALIARWRSFRNSCNSSANPSELPSCGGQLMKILAMGRVQWTATEAVSRDRTAVGQSLAPASGAETTDGRSQATKRRIGNVSPLWKSHAVLKGLIGRVIHSSLRFEWWRLVMDITLFQRFSCN